MACFISKVDRVRLELARRRLEDTADGVERTARAVPGRDGLVQNPMELNGAGSVGKSLAIMATAPARCWVMRPAGRERAG